MARRFTINPVAVILALLFWYWMWGVPGAILAVPMLAITKIVCDDLRPLRAFGHFLEGEPEPVRQYPTSSRDEPGHWCAAPQAWP